MTAKRTDQNPLREGQPTGATLFQAYQLVSKGIATRVGKSVCFRANLLCRPPHSLLPPIILTVCGSNAEVELKMAPDWEKHLKCTHWDFEIVDV